MAPEPVLRNMILELYKTFFKYSRIQGLLPYTFDPAALELTPITSGFFYYFFQFNTLYIILDVSKSTLLFASNYATNLQDEQIKGGYLLQLLWVIGPGSVLTMIFSFSHNRKEFAKTVSDCIRLESRIVAESWNEKTMANFKTRCRFLNVQVKGSIGFLMLLTSLLATVMWFLPRLPSLAFSHPVFRGYEEPWYLRALLTVAEAWLFPSAMGALFVNNILIFVTYRNLAGCVQALNDTLNQKSISELKKVESVSKYYQELQLAVGRLSTAFSAPLLFQELGVLCAIVLFTSGSSKIIVDDFPVISICFNLNAVQLLLGLIFQFYPMMVLNLNSRKILSWSHGRRFDTKYLQALVARHRELKIRPLGVHTVTLSTLSDYVIFVVSFIIMLNEV